MSTEPAGGTISGNSADTNTITDQQLFDQAVSDPTPAPSPSPGSSPAPSSTQPSDGQPSDMPPSTRPDLQQQPQPDGQQLPRNPQGQFAPKPPPGKGQPPQHVPLRELMEERERRQRLEAHTQELTRAVMALQQQLQPQQPQQPQGPQTIYDDPDAYLNERVMNPLRQEAQVYVMQVKDGLSRAQANQQFGQQEVDAALNAMGQIRNSPQGNFIFNQIMQSGHPYGELVQWHRQARAQAAIGADPQAWLREQQQRWANDPKVQDYIVGLARQRTGGSAQQQPNNVVELPPSLSSARSSSGRVGDNGDLSSASLYNFATK